MIVQEIKSPRADEKYIKIEHPSGLDIFIYPKDGHNSTYAVFGTKFGSVDTSFIKPGDTTVTTVPDGIAHYLEHKLFESEDGDAFARYAKTGASANAYTSFDMTSYLFSCTEKFEESLRILLDFVQSPYFTAETVQKEQGIIAQEIRMYDDSPDWRVMFNLLGAMFHRHPVRVDIAGSVESIAKINAENLYECHKAFYNLKNMALCISGKVDIDRVIAIADEMLKPTNVETPKKVPVDEPYHVFKKRVEQKFEISMPMFQMGYKEDASSGLRTPSELAQTEIILHALASKSSLLYRELLDANLINESFGYEYFNGNGYAAVVFSGESGDPDRTMDMIKAAVKTLHLTGINPEDFERAKKAIYGRNVAMLNSAENIANTLISFSFNNREIFDYIECLANTHIDDVNNRLKHQLDNDNIAVSLVLPITHQDNHHGS